MILCLAEIEPFDAKLAQRVQALSAQIENQTLQLASLRRDAPGATARRFEEDFKRRSEEDEARVRKQEEMDAEDLAASAAEASWHDSHAAEIEGLSIGAPLDWPACAAAGPIACSPASPTRWPPCRRSSPCSARRCCSRPASPPRSQRSR